MSADVARAVAHLIVLLWCLYLAFDERATGRNSRAWLWAALAAERMAFLMLLAMDVWEGGTVWMEYRAMLAPFVMVLAVALSIYGVNRIRCTRKARRAAYEPVDNNYYAREAAW
jgi:hypothetical protein